LDEQAVIQVRAQVTADKSSATLTVPPRPDPRLIPVEAGEGALREAGVEITLAVKQAIVKLFERAAGSDEPVSGVVAEAARAIDGTDGWVDWKIDAESARARAAARSDDERIDFREASNYILVKAGQVLGHVHAPTEGEDGRDVTGRAIPARRGHAAKIEVDESLHVDATGSIIAQDEGVLFREGAKAAVRRLLEVKGYVDFNTGNIDFNGDVLVHRGVRDCFKVKAEADIKVMGLIEAATIDSGQDLCAMGGFAGRERGFARVGRDFIGRYIDNVQGEVFGDLRIDREVINSEPVVHRGIDSPTAAIIGGCLSVSGRMRVGTLGSNGGVPTLIVLGAVPRLEIPLRRLSIMSRKLSEIEERLREEQRLASINNRPCAAEKERHTEIMFELANATAALTKARAAADALAQRIADQRVVDVRVERRLCADVRFRIADVVYRVRQDVGGPVRVELERGTELRYRQGDAKPKPLSQIADISSAPPAL